MKNKPWIGAATPTGLNQRSLRATCGRSLSMSTQSGLKGVSKPPFQCLPVIFTAASEGQAEKSGTAVAPSQRNRPPEK
jgi:hypothetical protein